MIVVDGQASKRCALLGDLLAAKMLKNGYAVRCLMPTTYCTAQTTHCPNNSWVAHKWKVVEGVTL